MKIATIMMAREIRAHITTTPYVYYGIDRFKYVAASGDFHIDFKFIRIDKFCIRKYKKVCV